MKLFDLFCILYIMLLYFLVPCELLVLLNTHNALWKIWYVFLYRLPFWQGHIVFTMSSKTWSALKKFFQWFLCFQYFIELKSINLKNSVYISLSLYIYIYICHRPHLTKICKSFLSQFLKFLSQFLKNSYLPWFLS